MNPRVKNVTYESPYKLVLTFTNNEQKLFDFTEYLSYPIYESLKNELLCSQAKVMTGTVVWNDEVDFDPDTLYLESKSLHMSAQ